MSPRISTVTCAKCGHSWVARVARPVQCPACKSREWNKKERKATVVEAETAVEEMAEAVSDKIDENGNV